jgi:branched-subunit amino acid transport protein
MVAWRQDGAGVSLRGVGAGVVSGLAALAASLVALAALQYDPLGLSPDARYWFGYAPQFATLAGLVVGTVVWRRGTSPSSTPERGVLAGVATAVGTVVLVPILAGLYVGLFPVLLGVVTGQDWQYALSGYPAHVRSSVDVTRTVAVGWSPFVGAMLVPPGAVVGWAYQRGRRSRGR